MDFVKKPLQVVGIATSEALRRCLDRRRLSFEFINDGCLRIVTNHTIYPIEVDVASFAEEDLQDICMFTRTHYPEIWETVAANRIKPVKKKGFFSKLFSK